VDEPLHFLRSVERSTSIVHAAAALRERDRWCAWDATTSHRQAVFADSFLGVPFLVAGTNRVAMLQKQIASQIANLPDLRVLECPFKAVR
jgi:hypothetical protein